MNPQSETNTYILKQLQAGLTPEDIAGQLRAAGWPDAAIQAAFADAQQQITPQVAAPTLESTTPEVSADPSTSQQPVEPVQLPTPIKRGRMKTGWLLFKQSLGVIKNNPGLSRYVIMNMTWSIGIFVVLIAIIIIDTMNGQVLFHDSIDSSGEESFSPSLLGLGVLVIIGFLSTAVTYYYGVALSSHALAIFRGTPGTYSAHIAHARKRLPAILTYAAIALVVGYLLRLLEERFKLVGLIVAKLLGALWALATSFVLPVIADSTVSGPQAIKQSVGLFKATWGETIVSRVSLTGLVVLIYVLVGIPITIILAIALGAAFGVFGILAALALYIVGIIILAILNTLAANVLNACLYYYAQYKIIPPAFSPELLASVFVEKKQKKAKR